MDPKASELPLDASAEYALYATERGQWKGERALPLVGIEDQDWALHLAPKTDELMLFHLPTDPQQFVNVAEQNPEVVERLRDALVARLAEAAAARLGDEGLGAGSGALEALQAIGYL